eukprot:13837897-Heterocapsa_arctica.AAC.1
MQALQPSVGPTSDQNCRRRRPFSVQRPPICTFMPGTPTAPRGIASVAPRAPDASTPEAAPVSAPACAVK